MNDETLKLKLSISRDLHSTFVRNIFGKRKFDDAALLNSRSFDDRSSSLELSQSYDSASFLSPASTGPSSMNLSGKTCVNLPLSVFEFCLLCDNSPKGDTSSSIIPESLQRSSSNLTTRKPRFPVRNPVYSPLEEERSEETRGSDSPSPNLSSFSRPVSFRSYFPIHIQKPSAFTPSSSSSASSSQKAIATKELFDRIGMIKLEPTRSRSYSDDEGLDSLKSKSGIGIARQPSCNGKAATEDAGAVDSDILRQNDGWDPSLMSSLSTPTIPPDTETVSPTPPVTRANSIETSGITSGGIGALTGCRGGNDEVVTAALLLLQGKSSSFTEEKPDVLSPFENKAHLKSDSKSSGSDDNNDIFSSHPPLPPPSSLLASNSTGNSRPSSRRFFPTSTFDSKSHPLIAVRNPKIEKMIHEANNRSTSRSNSPVLLAKLGRSQSSTAEESNSFPSSGSSQSGSGNQGYGSTSSNRFNRLSKEDLRQYRKVLGRRMKKLLASKKKSNKPIPTKLNSPL
jgi:hypothetical protein